MCKFLIALWFPFEIWQDASKPCICILKAAPSVSNQTPQAFLKLQLHYENSGGQAKTSKTIFCQLITRTATLNHPLHFDWNLMVNKTELSKVTEYAVVMLHSQQNLLHFYFCEISSTVWQVTFPWGSLNVVRRKGGKLAPVPTFLECDVAIKFRICVSVWTSHILSVFCFCFTQCPNFFGIGFGLQNIKIRLSLY